MEFKDRMSDSKKSAVDYLSLNDAKNYVINKCTTLGHSLKFWPTLKCEGRCIKPKMKLVPIKLRGTTHDPLDAFDYELYQRSYDEWILVDTLKISEHKDNHKSFKLKLKSRTPEIKRKLTIKFANNQMIAQYDEIQDHTFFYHQSYERMHICHERYAK